MSNALHDYANLFEKYAANNGGTCAILASEDCLALANEMRMDADAIDAENAKLRELCADFDKCLDTALWLAGEAGYPVMPDQKLFDSLRPRMRELGVIE